MMFLLVLLLFISYVSGMKAYESIFPLQDENADAGIQLIVNSSKTTTEFTAGLTLCGRFNFKRIGRLNSGPKPAVFHFLLGIDNEVYLRMDYSMSHLDFGADRVLLKDRQRNTFQIWTPNRWSHVCLAFNASNQHLILVKDGIQLVDKVLPDFKQGLLSSSLLKTLTFGKKNGLSSGHSCHGGSITDINLWDVPLNQEQLEDWTSCRLPGLNGNIVDWPTSKWSLTNVREITIEESSLCKANMLGATLIPEKLTASRSVQLCQKLNGQLFLMKDEASLKKALDIKSNYVQEAEECLFSTYSFWAGWWDVLKEGHFVDMYDSEIELNISRFETSPWGPTEPNGDTAENCVILETYWCVEKEGCFSDLNCETYQLCSICDIRQSPIFKLRGLKEPHIDADYAWTGELQFRKYIFRGFSQSSIYFEAGSWSWQLNSRGNETYGLTVGSTDGYPMGIHKWDIENGTKKIQLSFSSCHENQYNCDDGACVNLTQRCDGAMDCKDHSDEFHCYKIRTDKEFKMIAMPPPPLDQNQKLEVLSYVEIVNILEINEVSAKITLQLKITIEWTDTRMDFMDLKSDEHLNTLTPEETNDIWIPELVFGNTRNNQRANFRNASSYGFVRINEGASRIPTPLEELHNGFIHSGKDCTIVSMDTFTVDFIYNFEMNNYPFDSQIFQAILDIPRKERSKVQLVPGNISYKGPHDLMKYTIKKYELLKGSGGNAIIIEIHLGRQILNEVLTTVLPTMIITIVSFSTNHYGANRFDACVTVNLTSLLVMATLFISVFSSLPRTSALKMIDIWFIFTLFIPFLEVILHTKMAAINHQIHEIESRIASAWSQDQEEKETMRERKLQKVKLLKCLSQITTIGLPLTALLFLIGFFLVGLLLA